MDVPRLVPGDEPGSFIVYLARPGTFEFALIPSGVVYPGPLRITIVNILVDGSQAKSQHPLFPVEIPLASFDRSSQSSSPVATSQPDMDLEISLHSALFKPLITSPPIAVPASIHSCPVSTPAPALEEDIHPARGRGMDSEHRQNESACSDRQESDTASALVGDAGCSSLNVSPLLAGLQEIFADPVQRDALLSNLAHKSLSPLIDFLGMDMDLEGTSYIEEVEGG
ncbi:hypothetical protein BV25DRAFT_1922506 [Artomyces pyxidatus]|uniref:Uncharacterized protein n=1 Tax=Artomyces pyxidatus TaxID=48021 RepID=A0ACB8SF56_9AGAM|nr:hypothetical protein BV25DRAFT_1922506 [Artomyces pyxidatus]